MTRRFSSIALALLAAGRVGTALAQDENSDERVADSSVAPEGAGESTARADVDPNHYDPGDLIPRTLVDFGSIGVTNAPVVAPNMRFPIEEGPAFSNSQIFHPGGWGYAWTTSIVYPGPGGAENEPANYNYPWRDNFCEVRRRDSAGCPSGLGHQGQDIRPKTCEQGVHYAVAVEDAVVKALGEHHMVLLYGLETGNVYTYLHMTRPLEPGIVEGAEVKKGQRLGRISNILGEKDRTTTHLHFEIWAGGEQEGTSKGVVPLSPYTSLVESYLDLVAANPQQLEPVTQPEDWRKCRRPG
jgi:murein DD-endopeptidase MepM/ murein hydrolase activator NlpD